MNTLAIIVVVALFVVGFYNVFIEDPQLTGSNLWLCLLFFASGGICLCKTIFSKDDEEDSGNNRE
ncbi:MAG: hypothetical protein IJZ16_13490 [Clostridia bacterium]|nr:hypothetical protein [Clostridia bacterium]